MSKNSTIVRAIRLAAPLASKVAPRWSASLLEKLFTTPFPAPVPRREKDWMQGANQQTLLLEDGETIPCYTWGDQGPWVVLIHGWAGRASQMAVFAAPLLDAGLRVAAFDAPGHGAAGCGRSALPRFVVSLEAVADHLGEVHGVVAHSLGTAAATLAMSRGLKVRKAVYIAPPEDLGGYLSRLTRQLRFHPEVGERTRSSLEARYGVPFDHARGIRLAPQMTAALLAFHDRTDREVELAEGRRLTEAWPGAELRITEGLGHNRILRDPEVLAESASFLAG